MFFKGEQQLSVKFKKRYELAKFLKVQELNIVLTPKSMCATIAVQRFVFVPYGDSHTPYTIKEKQVAMYPCRWVGF